MLRDFNHTKAHHKQTKTTIWRTFKKNFKAFKKTGENLEKWLNYHNNRCNIERFHLHCTIFQGARTPHNSEQLLIFLNKPSSIHVSSTLLDQKVSKDSCKLWGIPAAIKNHLFATCKHKKIKNLSHATYYF